MLRKLFLGPYTYYPSDSVKLIRNEILLRLLGCVMRVQQHKSTSQDCHEIRQNTPEVAREQNNLQGHPTNRFGKLSFGRPLIPSDFLETIVTLNFRDMRNLMSVAFGLSKLSFLVPKKGQISFSERREDLKFSGLDKKIPNKFENTQVPLEYPNR